MNVYPLTFEPIYKEKIWGGRNLARLFGRELPADNVGESWELADLENGVSVVANGPLAGKTLTEVTAELGSDLLGGAKAQPDGRFPLLLKLLDANGILSLQVHPDAEAVAAIGGSAALKTECWYVVDSRDGYIYKGVKEGVSPERFREAIESDTCEEVVVRYDVVEGDFHYLPAGTVHAIGTGLVIAEVQTPSDTTYRVTDWGRGREIHVERSMQCIHFEPAGDVSPGAEGDTLLVTDFFSVSLKTVGDEGFDPPAGRCTALMLLEADGNVTISYGNDGGGAVTVRAGDTALLPAALEGARLSGPCRFLEITLPEN